MIDCKNEQEWLAERKKYLTASDAGLYCDINPYQPNGPTYLYDIKTGNTEAANISGKWAVKRGKAMEKHIRALFMIDNPNFQLSYHEFGLYVSKDYPFMAATLDGLLKDRNTGDIYVLEIKTATCQTFDEWKEWERGEIPQHYIAQGMHQLICVPVAKGVIFYAFVTNAFTGRQMMVRKEYFRDECGEDIEFVLVQAQNMHGMIERRQRPRIKLNI